MPHLHHGAFGSFGSVLLTLTIVFTALVYIRGWMRLRLSVDNLGAWRACGFLLGLLMIWLAAASPLSALDHELLTVHMLQHLLLMSITPPLIWLGAPVRPLLKGLPQRFVEGLIQPVFRWSPVRRLVTVFAHPALCWLLACAVLIGWHIPALFTFGLQSAAWHFVEHASFLAAGLLFWWPVIQPWPSVPRWPDLSIILYLFFATLPCDILSGFLVFCDRVVYPVYTSSSHLFDLTALEDQQSAGALMWTGVTVIYLVAGTILTTRLLSPQRPRGLKLIESNVLDRAPQKSLEVA